MKKLLLFVMIGVFAVSCGKDPISGPDPGPGPGSDPDGIELAPKEMRSVWFTTVWQLDWPNPSQAANYQYDEAAQKKMYTDYLDKFLELNINTVFVQVRSNADSFYKSEYEPWSRWITGVRDKDPGYDVLGFMLEEAHKRGLEFHAWINPFRIGSRASDATPYPDLDPKINPDWVKSYKLVQAYNPALPEVQQRLADIVKDLLDKYDLDGIHMDDYFYPDPTQYTSLDDAADYAKYGAGYATIDEFRFANVDKVIQKIGEVVRQKPGVVYSISPMSDNGANARLFADPTKWCKEGWIDVIIPQLYQTTGTSANSFNISLSWWNQFAYKAVPMVGYALYRFGDGESPPLFQTTSELVDQFKRARNMPKTKGHIFYSAKFLNFNRMGITDVIKRDIYPRPAVIPFVGSKSVADPTPATNVALTGSKLTWNAASGLRTVIYKVEAKKGLVVAVTSGNEYTLTEKGEYCLTTLNRDNTESELSDIITYD